MRSNKLTTVVFIKLFMMLNWPNYISQWQLRIAFPFKERIKNGFAVLYGSLFESSGRETKTRASTHGMLERTYYKDMQEKYCDLAREALRI